MKKQLKIGIWAILALGLLCAMGLAFVDIPWCAECPHRHAEKPFVPPEGDIPGHPTPSSEKMECRPNIQLSNIQRRELAKVFLEINAAYTNCQVEVLLFHSKRNIRGRPQADRVKTPSSTSNFKEVFP